MKSYSRNEVFKKSLEYFKGDSLAADVWINKYSLKDSDGNIYELTPNDMHDRLASELSRIENKYPNPLSKEKIFDLIKDFKYIVPQGGPMAGIGNNLQTISLSNCFVIGNDADSYGGIMMTDQEQAQLMKRRGGVGHDLSHIRPKGSPVKNSALTSTGVVPFMERFSNSTREVAQDGRRGALMLTISVKHPDAEDFIDAKMTQGKVTGANVSVKLTDEFMECVRDKKPFIQQYPIDSDNPLYTKEIDANKLWNKIVHNAWQSAEPGLMFWDTISREAIPDCYSEYGFKTISTNPCGEIPLNQYDSCRLLAINLYSYVENPFTENAKFNWELFEEHSIYAQRFMDDIVDLEVEKVDAILEKIKNDPEPEYIKIVEIKLWEKIREKAIQGRRTGLGITSEGDMLAALGITYGSEESIEFSTKVHKILAISAYKSSIIMAKERGSFEVFDFNKEKENPFVKRILNELSDEYVEMWKNTGRRNIALLTIAPTGSVSIMTQTSSGIEPVFLPVYTRRRKINPNDKNAKISFVDEVGDFWEEYNVFHPKFKTWSEVNGYNVEELEKSKPSEIEKIVKLSPYHKATSNDVDWVSKVKLQGSVQKWIDHSISVTVNLPNYATEEIVGKVYETGWSSGCFPKGQSVYTLNGIKDISEIKRGDMVYGVDKRLHNVNDVFVLPKEERILHHIKASGLEEISATSEHPFYVIELDESENKKSWVDRKKEFKWKLAKDIKPNDHLVVPNSFENITEEKIDLKISDYLDVPTIIENDEISLARKLPWKKDKLVKSSNSNSIPNTIKITDDFLRFIGWFIAEGHYNGKSEIRLTLNKEKELDILLELAEIVEEVFGIKTFIEESVGNAVRLRFHSRIVSLFLEKLVGRYSKNKHLPDWYQFLEPNKLNILLKSYYLGDGGTTISTQLARELFHAKILVNKKPYFKSNYGEGYYVNESIQDKSKRTAKEHDGYLCYRVNKNTLEIYKDNVYNLAVDGVDSYVVNGAIVHNCKGITVYRDGSRSGVLISNKEANKKTNVFTENNAPKRPELLPCDVYRFQNKGEKWIGFMGLLDNRPYEIFTGLQESVNIPNYVSNGHILKIKNAETDGKSRYDFIYIDKDGYKQEFRGLSRAFNREYWNTGRLISGILRHGMPIPNVLQLIDKLHFDNEDSISSWKSGIKRTLKKYIKEGTLVKGETCDNCGSSNIIYKEGCMTCMDCQTSKCE